MAVEYFRFTLRVWSRQSNGGKESITKFLREKLKIAPGDSVSIVKRRDFLDICLLNVSMEEFAHVDTTEDGGAQSMAFESAIREGIVGATKWLENQSSEIFAELRGMDYITDVFIGGWLTDDQFDLDLPAEFLKICGTLGLSISICTND